MYRSCLYLSVALAVILYASLANADGVCSGYPKMYNGKPCASTTRYYDGQMGACGCGTGNTSPFSWQWTKPTAAASAPIFGSETWCGTGCGKCFKLTPTAIGASPEGTGAPALASLVVKVTNLCPYGGNEAWCAYDTNSFGYDAHFDLMDYNMNGLVSSMGWNNPEVIYEEVDCDANGYTDWNCQCASADSTGSTSTSTAAPTVAPGNKATKAPTAAPKATKAPTTAPKATTKATTKAPTTAPKVTTTAPANMAPANKAPTAAPTAAPTTAPVAATTAPVAATTVPVAATSAPVAATTAPAAGSSGNAKIQVNGGSNNWWVGFSLLYPAVSAVSYVEIKDSSASTSWNKLTYQGTDFWNLYSYNPSAQIVLPLSIRITSVSGNVVTASNIITSFQAATVDTGVAV